MAKWRIFFVFRVRARYEPEHGNGNPRLENKWGPKKLVGTDFVNFQRYLFITYFFIILMIYVFIIAANMNIICPFVEGPSDLRNYKLNAEIQVYSIPITIDIPTIMQNCIRSI